MKEQKKLLEAAGWTCSPCACPGKNGFDCANKNKRGYIIMLRETGFRIFNKGHKIEVGHMYQLPDKLIQHGIN